MLRAWIVGLFGAFGIDKIKSFIWQIFRHGARNIEKTYPNDPYKNEKFWPEGLGQLTKEGKRQLFELGLYLRRRYNNLLGARYSPNDVYIQSTDVDRTLMSAQACLAGLFVPSEEETWNDRILWQPIPVNHLIVFFIYDQCLIYCCAMNRFILYQRRSIIFWQLGKFAQNISHCSPTTWINQKKCKEFIRIMRIYFHIWLKWADWMLQQLLTCTGCTIHSKLKETQIKREYIVPLYRIGLRCFSFYFELYFVSKDCQNGQQK